MELPTTPPLALGRTAEVYAWQPGTILKLYLAGYPASAAESEFQRARAAHTAGIRTPAPVELVTIAGRSGLVYERVDGPTLSDTLFAAPETMDAAAAAMAELHATLHRATAPEVPAQKERLRGQIARAVGLSPATQAAVLAELEQLPADRRLCHGDLHPSNILVTDAGPVLIDWVDLTAGHPCADVARTALLLGYSALPPELTAEQRAYIFAMRRHFLDTYLDYYTKLQAVTRDEIGAWQRVVAAARLSEGIADADEVAALIALASAG